MNFTCKVNLNLLLLVILSIIIFSENVFCKPAVENEDSLELVAILHRHGFRTALKAYQFDPYKDQKKYWPLGWGQLTLKGKQQLYKLGKTLRDRYKEFVPKHTVQTVRVNSSDILRCHMSVGALLAGMFPPDKDQVWTDELNWQPIPIHSVPIEQDNILALEKPCPRYDIEKEKSDIDIHENVLTKSDKLVLKYLSDHMGENMTSLDKVNDYWSTLIIEQLNGYVLPEWTKSVFPEPYTYLSRIGGSGYNWNKILQKFRGGPFIKEVVQQFTDKKNGKNGEMKLFIYSAHDSTIQSVWRALQFEELLLPDFGAALIFELHKSEKEHFIKMMYMNNTDTVEPFPLDIPNCSAPCKLSSFADATEYVRSIDWDKDCQDTTSSL